MPSWNIHLEAGNRLADQMHLSGKARKAFLLGCLLPDINNGYINEVSIKKEHGTTHYTFDQKSSLNFYAENKAQIDQKNPLFLGYLFHLYTDGFFNYDFYHTVKRHPIGKNKSREEKREVKHHDFWIFDTNFHHILGLTPEERTELAPKASQISSVDITAEDIADVERVLSDPDFSDAMKNEKYLFYTPARLEKLMNDMIASFSKDYLKDSTAPEAQNAWAPRGRNYSSWP